MPSNFIYRPPFTKRGQNWLPPSKPPLADVTGSGGVVLGGSATLVFGHNLAQVTGSGGVEIGGSATVQFVHAPQVESDIVVEWDFDNDTDFGSPEEDITSQVLTIETFAGRDWPSLLTGKAGPGRLRATLRNEDDRFNYFNSDSPLVTAPFSLKTGRRIRVRTSDASTPDPVLLGKDRFRRASGALGTDETGKTYSEPLTHDFVIAANRAVASSEGDPHMALLDTGSTDYYVQAKVSALGGDNRAGVVYRYVDATNYSLLVIDAQAESLELIDVTAGVETIIASQEFEVYSGATVGVLVSGTSVTAYLEGVSLLSGTAINASAELVGLYAQWRTGQDRPELDELYVWDGLPIPTEGILWTGDVAELISSVEAGPKKAASVTGTGWLSKLSSQEIIPPASVVGRKTGLLAGNALASAMAIHPPGLIDEGVVTTGVFAMDRRSALAVVRDVEEIEFGFLYETNEGYLSFRDRDHRDGSTSLVTFSDDPGAQFGYHEIKPYDWRNEVFNRVSAGISPWTGGEEAVLFTDPGPYVLTSGQMTNVEATYAGTVMRWTGHTRDVAIPGAPTFADVTESSGTTSGTTIDVDLPATVNANDLLLIVLSTNRSGDSSTPPSGFTELKDQGSSGRLAIAAKVAAGTEDGSTAQFTGLPAGSKSWQAHVYRVSSFFGDVNTGIQVSSVVSSSDFNPNPPLITPAWGSEATLYIAAAEATVVAWAPVDGFTVNNYPSGYTNGTDTVDSTSGHGLVSASRSATVSSENPGSFSLSPDEGDDEGFTSWSALTIAVRGGVGAPTTITSAVPAGTDGTFAVAYDNVVGGSVQTHTNIQVTGVPLVQGDQSFAQVDDYDSQDDHNAIRTYQTSANLFANVTDAEGYANLVLSTYADDRPIVSISFYATKSPAYRLQAIKRRIGDKITLVANNNAGLGVAQDFFIESITHTFSNGTRLWECTWELSPA